MGLVMVSPLSAQHDLKMVEMSATISGTSTMHDWTSKVTEIYFEGRVTLDSGKISSFENAIVKIPVSSIKSDRGNLMDRNTWNALKIEQYPSIDFNLKEATIINKKDGGLDIRAVGDLTLVGNTQATELELYAMTTAANSFTIRGSKSILMSDFEMKPPSFLFGAYTTGDLVIFDFELKLVAVDQHSSAKID